MQEASNEKTKNNSNELNNLDLAYSYAEYYLSTINKNLDDLNTRLTTFLGFSGLLLRFAIELPSGCNSTFCAKLGAIGLSAFAAIWSAWGLTANPIGRNTKLKALMSDKWFNREAAINRATIVNTWIEGEKEIEDASFKKQQRLNISIYLLVAAIIFFAVNLLLATSIQECGKLILN